MEPFEAWRTVIDHIAALKGPEGEELTEALEIILGNLEDILLKKESENDKMDRRK